MPLDIAEIFAPIQDGIPRVEKMLSNLSIVDYSLLRDILGHILRRRGKRLRPALALLAGSFYDYNLDLLVPAATSVELLHTATLVHDDTVDHASSRRGQPTVNRLWNGNIAVLVGDYLFANAADIVARTGSVRVVQIFARTLTTICSAELEQAFNAYRWGLGRGDYFARISKKTAALFGSAAEAGAVLSGAPEEHVQSLRSYGMNLGIAFQIVDDILDFIGSSEEMGKPVGNDLLQGTLTLPAILLGESYPHDNPVRRFCEAGRKEDDLSRVIEMVNNSDIISRCYQVAADFCQKARSDLAELPDRSPKVSLLSLVDYVMERQR